MKDKFVFKYDKDTKKGIIVINKAIKKINLEENYCRRENLQFVSSERELSSGSCGGGYGLHLI